MLGKKGGVVGVEQFDFRMGHASNTQVESQRLMSVPYNSLWRASDLRLQLFA